MWWIVCDISAIQLKCAVVVLLCALLQFIQSFLSLHIFWLHDIEIRSPSRTDHLFQDSLFFLGPVRRLDETLCTVLYINWLCFWFNISKDTSLILFFLDTANHMVFLGLSLEGNFRPSSTTVFLFFLLTVFVFLNLASKAVDCLLDSKWAKAKKGEEALFTTRESVVDYCNRLAAAFLTLKKNNCFSYIEFRSEKRISEHETHTLVISLSFSWLIILFIYFFYNNQLQIK